MIWLAEGYAWHCSISKHGYNCTSCLHKGLLCRTSFIYSCILRPCSHSIFVDNVVDNNTQKRKSVGSGSISHLNDISCGCKVDIGNVFSNGPYQTRLVRPMFTSCEHLTLFTWLMLLSCPSFSPLFHFHLLYCQNRVGLGTRLDLPLLGFILKLHENPHVYKAA